MLFSNTRTTFSLALLTVSHGVEAGFNAVARDNVAVYWGWSTFMNVYHLTLTIFQDKILMEQAAVAWLNRGYRPIVQVRMALTHMTK